MALLLVLLSLDAFFGHRLYRAFSQPLDLYDEALAPDWYYPPDPVAQMRASEPVRIPNFGQVSEMLYRSGRPTGGGFRLLKKLGIQIVVDFEEGPAEISAEKQAVESLGMVFVSIPWQASDKPDSEQVAEFLRLVRRNPDKKILVHCEAGHDRTGVMVAMYRMAMQDWTPNQALREMEAYGFRHNVRHFWMRHLEKYVLEFPAQVSHDPNLRRFHQDPCPSSPRG